MTITRAREITADFENGDFGLVTIDELGEYKSLTDAAMEWAQENRPMLYYGLIYRYLQHLENTDRHTCSVCKYWESFPGVCFNADSQHCADFVDGDCTCADWKARLKK